MYEKYEQRSMERETQDGRRVMRAEKYILLSFYITENPLNTLLESVCVLHIFDLGINEERKERGGQRENVENKKKTLLMTQKEATM